MIQEVMTISNSEFEGEAIDMDSVAFAGKSKPIATNIFEMLYVIKFWNRAYALNPFFYVIFQFHCAKGIITRKKRLRSPKKPISNQSHTNKSSQITVIITISTATSLKIQEMGRIGKMIKWRVVFNN